MTTFDMSMLAYFRLESSEESEVALGYLLSSGMERKSPADESCCIISTLGSLHCR